jgi:ATP-dependent Clp protease ATP-binding subunit ClpC
MEMTSRLLIIIELAKHDAACFLALDVEPRHLELAFLQEGLGVGIEVLKCLGINIDALRKELVSRLSKEMVLRPMARPLGISLEYTKLLEQSKSEAIKFGHSYVGSEHLLVALFVNNVEPIASAIDRDKISVERIRQTIEDVIRPRIQIQNGNCEGPNQDEPASSRT